MNNQLENRKGPTGYKPVPAVDKCVKILELFEESRTPLGVSAIAQRLGFDKSTVFNIVYTLQELGLLERVLETKAFKRPDPPCRHSSRHRLTSRRQA
jgi:hypothetical protein